MTSRSRRRSAGTSGLPSVETRWYGCRVASGRRLLLGIGEREIAPPAGAPFVSELGGFALAGDYVAFARGHHTHYGPEESRVLEANLATGRISSIWSASGDPWSEQEVERRPVGRHGRDAVEKLAVDVRGDVAWAAREAVLASAGASGQQNTGVLVHDRLGTHLVADYPTPNEDHPHSGTTKANVEAIAISSSAVSWTFGGRRYTVPH